MDLADRFASLVQDFRFDRLPAPVVHEAKRRVIDSVGCAFGAWNEEPSRIARKVASAFATPQGSSLWGTSIKAPSDWASFANGCMIRYFDYNDTYLSLEPAHPSDNISAAFSVAEREQLSGQHLITALVLAYEIQCRLCDTSSIRARGWDHVTYGAFSTACAASYLMKLSIPQTRHALGIAGVASAALRQSRVGELSHWKGCAFANAARHGTYAALLAREGMTGPAPIFEGEKGFEKLVSGSLSGIILPDMSSAKPDLMILKTSVKYWPAEYHAQSAIEAALKIRKSIPPQSEIVSVIIESHDAAVDIIGSEIEKWNPRSRETADHSLPYMVAAALMDGEITDRQFEPSRYTDPMLLGLLQQVRVERNAELTALYPQAVANSVQVTLADGTIFKERVDYPRGHAMNPLSDAELEGKFHVLVDPLLGPPESSRLLQKLWQLESQKTLNDLLPLVPVK